MCPFGYGRCYAPDAWCPHWIGIFCELEEEFYK